MRREFPRSTTSLSPYRRDGWLRTSSSSQKDTRERNTAPRLTSLLTTAALTALTWAVVSGAPAQATLKADYVFENTRASSIPAPALTDLGAGNSFVTDTVDSVSRIVLQFPEGNGLSLSPTLGVIPSGTYTIVILFRFATVSGFRRIVDFKNGTSDRGLYNESSNLVFFDVADGSHTPIGAGIYVQVALTRDAGGNVVGYVNGTPQITFTDGSNLAVIDGSTTLRFFQDDTEFPDEASAGAVARIRLFDTALSPLEVAALDSCQAPPRSRRCPSGASLCSQRFWPPAGSSWPGGTAATPRSNASLVAR